MSKFGDYLKGAASLADLFGPAPEDLPEQELRANAIFPLPVKVTRDCSRCGEPYRAYAGSRCEKDRICVNCDSGPEPWPAASGGRR